ncbi:MAG: histidine phosphatase family protein [Opitutae bacterium]|nr:histidine phosphatase family protein [Opitutae bacterium]
MYGQALLHTLAQLDATTDAAVMLRHAARFPITDPRTATTIELTPQGFRDAEAFGGKLTGFSRLRLHHSPVKRCQQTAEAIARGASANGLAVEWRGAQDLLGVSFIIDEEETARLTVLHGEAFLRLWLAQQVDPRVIRPAAALAADYIAYFADGLRTSDGGRRLDLHVSHDWNTMVLREIALGVRHEEAGWLEFLDGITFQRDNGALRTIYRHHSVRHAVPA